MATKKSNKFFPPVPKTPVVSQPAGAKRDEEKAMPVVDEVVEQVVERHLHLVPTQRISFQDLPLDRIRPNPFQARKEFTDEDLEELAVAIRQHGFISVLLVRPDPGEDGYFELAYGERRWRAAKLVADCDAVPCRIVDYTDEQMEDIGLIENLQRKDLNPIEEAHALQRKLQRVNPATGERFSIRTLAEHLGVKKHRVEETLRLCDVPEDVQEMVRTRPDTIRVAFEIAKLPDPDQRQPLIEGVLQRRMNTREVMYLVGVYLAQARQEEELRERKLPPSQGDTRSEPSAAHLPVSTLISSSVQVPEIQEQIPGEENTSKPLRAEEGEEHDPEISATTGEQETAPVSSSTSYDNEAIRRQLKLQQDVRAINAVLSRWEKWAEEGNIEKGPFWLHVDVSYELSRWISQMQDLYALVKKKRFYAQREQVSGYPDSDPEGKQ